MKRLTTAEPEAALVPAGDSPLIDREELAALLTCSTRTVARLSSDSLLPAPIRLGGMVRWRRSQILDWIEDGCPAPKRTRGGSRSGTGEGLTAELPPNEKSAGKGVAV
ncbi:MAG: hypothetical protein DHS20C21_01850 [Gemmatimonadota bacterium]|nr:MAG: hypothetical protein DHS20C21_01850 [Gemmatimonadota bacterium]